MERGRVARVTVRWQRGAVIACGLLAFAAAEIAHAQGRRGDLEGPRGPRGGERIGAATAEPPPPPPPPPSPVGGSTNPFPGPITFPGGAHPVNTIPGPTPVVIQPAPVVSIPGAPGAGGPFGTPTPGPAASSAALAIAPARALGPAPVSAAVAPSAAAPSTSSGGSRITEIIPPVSAIAPSAFGRDPSMGRLPVAADARASADSCVNVFVRSAKVDGREVVSVDLHGDGLIKGAVPPQLAGELLARAGPAAGGARAACVPPALAQSLFNPVVNLAAVDPAVRMARVGDRWPLAGSREPQLLVVKPQAPLQLAAATTTRGAPKAQAKKPVRAPVKPRPPAIQVSYAIYP